MFNLIFILFLNGNIIERVINTNIINNKIELIFCTFFNIKSNTHGGCILIDTTTSILLNIFETLVYNCSSGFNSEYNGGFYYFQSTLGNVNLKKVCGSHIKGLRGSFFYSTLVQTNNNFQNFTLISQNKICPDFFPIDSLYCLNIIYGKININYLNSTFNHIYHSCSITIFNCELNNFSFCQFSNNPADIVIGTVSVLFNTPISYSNFLNNPKYFHRFGLIHSNSCSPSLLINQCIFLNNSQTLFDEYTSKITISNSIIDFYSVGTGSPILINCSTNSITSIYKIQMLNTFLCLNEKKYSNNRIKLKFLFRLLSFYLL